MNNEDFGSSFDMEDGTRSRDGKETENGKPSKLVEEEHLVPKHCTLDGFAEESNRHGGIDITQLDPLTRLLVQTQNTCYQLTLLDPGNSKIMIQGGRFFVDPTEASLCGASFGGSFLKSRWIGVMMRMEVNSGGRNIVTSPVCSVETQNDESLPGPF